MIAIVNIDSNLRKNGKHLYEIRINNKIITTFKHNREEKLSICLEKALKAIKRYELESIANLICYGDKK